jgi:hypothetical protein
MVSDLEYRDGQLFWTKSRPGRRVNSPVGCLSPNGYLVVRIDGKLYYAHRLVWALCKGSPVPDTLDHINGNRSDNRIENLRPATTKDNTVNRKKRANAKSKWYGVTWSKKSNCWKTQYMIDGVNYYVGEFLCELDAATAYNFAVYTHDTGFYNYNQVTQPWDDV